MINFNWFSRGDPEDGGKEDTSLSREQGSLGGVASLMDSMDNLKKSQRMGKITETFVQELSSMTVEGTSSDGKVKVVFDCQQQPISVSIDESYFVSAGVADVAEAITVAMRDAHAKSIERMDDKLKGFYTEIGLTAD